MANIIQNNKSNLSFEGIRSLKAPKAFGKPEDYIELHIYDAGNNLVHSEENFNSFTLPELAQSGMTSEINMDPTKILKERGLASGTYTLEFNIQKKLIANSFSKIFKIKKISSSRREISAISNIVSNSDIRNAVNNIQGYIGMSKFFKEFILNFGDNKLSTAINIAYNNKTKRVEVLFKLYEPLPSSITTLAPFRVCENITDKIVLKVDLALEPIKDDGIPLRGPNFKIDVRMNNSIPSAFKTYDEILEYGTTSSYENLLNKLEKHEIPEIAYDYVRTYHSSSLEVGYHFDNFVHFGSATELLKNFEYKLKLIELYDKQLVNVNAITGATSTSSFVLTDKSNIYSKKEKIIQGFDGYERFLYYETGSNVYAWPKQTGSIDPYILHSVTSSEALNWMGGDKDNFGYYGGQLLSASLYDIQNPDMLSNLLPQHIKENDSHSNFTTFMNMLGQHFDQIWTHIKHIVEVKDTHHTTGISKDLVYFQLKSLGLETFDQFENANLLEYMLGGEGVSGSQFYTTSVSESLVTASYEDGSSIIDGSIPKGDITKRIWKRLYHNAPYLLKTKGTERGLKALMSCYGVPSTILNVKEYGGSTSDKTTYKTFSYDKSGLALQGNSGGGGYFVQTPWSGSATDALSSSAKTVEFRIRPERSNSNYHLFTISGSVPKSDPHLILKPYIGNDISSSGDSTQYGKLELYESNSLKGSTNNFPVYNGDFWNIHIGTDGTSGSSALTKFGAYKANHLKNIFKYTGSATVTEASRSATWGDPYSESGHWVGGGQYAYIGGTIDNNSNAYSLVDGLSYSGSMQEVRYYFGEMLSESTLKKHALEPFMYAGNSVSSSYDYCVLRLPLGSNDMKDSSSFHPKNASEPYLAGRGPEIVRNGGMELNSDWVIHSGGTSTGTAPTEEQSSTYAASGSYSWKYTVTENNDGIKQTGISLEKNKLYEIKWDIYVPAGSTDHHNQLTFIGTKNPTSGNTFILGNTAVDGQWVSSTTYMRATATTSTAYVIFTPGGGWSSGTTTYYIDNVSIKEIVVVGPVPETSTTSDVSPKSSIQAQSWEEVTETHHLPTPDTVGASMTSEKLRIDKGTIDDNFLSPTLKAETSTLDRQPQDFEDLGVFFSPTNEINEDIIYTLGAFRLDDYIGSPLPSAQTASNYEDLKALRDEYSQKLDRSYNYWDYIKLIQQIDHTLFKLVEQWVPMKANLKTGLLIEPHYLERSKFARELPTIEYGRTMEQGSYQTLDFQIDPELAFTLQNSAVVTTNNLSFITGSEGYRTEVGTNVTIDIDDYILDEIGEVAQSPIIPNSTASGKFKRISNVLLGNATKGRKSAMYYRSHDRGKEFDF